MVGVAMPRCPGSAGLGDQGVLFAQMCHFPRVPILRPCLWPGHAGELHHGNSSRAEGAQLGSKPPERPYGPYGSQMPAKKGPRCPGLLRSWTFTGDMGQGRAPGRSVMGRGRWCRAPRGAQLSRLHLPWVAPSGPATAWPCPPAPILVFLRGVATGREGPPTDARAQGWEIGCRCPWRDPAQL